ncbi:MAG: 4-vinyl reductase [Chloroflexaceae bacterium]|nr:4-vinyl reductase [Chloroflexaceae bacterium]NJL33974.1 4-vinyl reductase [Chloroflexaceae bacterium]NJO06445.1 4-vinyl reductase [Chloroflexaceae bacterium]
MTTVEAFRGLHYPNKIGRLCFLSLEEVMGRNGVNALLRLAGQEQFINNYPPNDLKKEFPFEGIAATETALQTMYGPRGSRGLELRAGRVAFTLGLKEFGPLLGMADLALKLMPVTMKLKIVLNATAQTFDRFSDQASHVEEERSKFIYHITKDPSSLRSDPGLNFYIARGILEEATAWVSGGRRFSVEQVSSIALGDPTTAFEILKEPLD